MDKLKRFFGGYKKDNQQTAPSLPKEEKSLRPFNSLPNLRINLDDVMEQMVQEPEKFITTIQTPHGSHEDDVALCAVAENNVQTNDTSLCYTPMEDIELVNTPVEDPHSVSVLTNRSRRDSTKKRSYSFNGKLGSRFKTLMRDSEDGGMSRSMATLQVVQASDYQFNFHLILQNRETCHEFQTYLKRTGCSEGLEFMAACDDLAKRVTHLNVRNQMKHASNNVVDGSEDHSNSSRKSVESMRMSFSDSSATTPEEDLKQLYTIATEIYNTYIEPKSFKEVNISGEIRNWIYLEMQQLQLFFQHEETREALAKQNANINTPRSIAMRRPHFTPLVVTTANTATQEIPEVDLETFRGLFKMAYNSVRVNLESDSFQRFVRSDAWNTYFSKNLIRLFSMNKGMAVHKSKIQIRQLNRTDFVREFITERDLEFVSSLTSSSQFWTVVYEKSSLNELKVSHSGNETILDRKAEEIYGKMPVIKQEAVYKCSYHELIKLITSQEYGIMIGFLGTDITNCVSGKRPIGYSKVEYKRSHERQELIKQLSTTPRGNLTPRGVLITPRSGAATPRSPITPSPRTPSQPSSDGMKTTRSSWNIVLDQSGDRVFNSASFICEVPSNNLLEKKKQLTFCSSTIYDSERKCYYHILKPIPILDTDRTSKCTMVHAFICTIVQQIEENVCRFIQFVSSNGRAATSYTRQASESNATADDIIDEAEDEDERVHVEKVASKVKHGAKKQCYMLLSALSDWERRPKLTDLCFANQTLRDNSREEEEEKIRKQKQREDQRKLSTVFFQSLRRKISISEADSSYKPSPSLVESPTPTNYHSSQVLEPKETTPKGLSLAHTHFFQALVNKNRQSQKLNSPLSSVTTPQETLFGKVQPINFGA